MELQVTFNVDLSDYTEEEIAQIRRRLSHEVDRALNLYLDHFATYSENFHVEEEYGVEINNYTVQ